MRPVLNVVAACLLAILVTATAEKVFENSVPTEKISEVAFADKDQHLATKNVPNVENLGKPEDQINADDKLKAQPQNNQELNQKQPEQTKAEDVNRKDQTAATKPSPEQPNEPKPQDLIRIDQNDNKENIKPEKVDAEKFESDSSKPVEKVTYNGVKVLRVVIQNKEQKKMLRQLENKGDINTWSGNGTAVDILIRQDNVFNILKDKKLVYDVIIDDLQKAIEEENPPIPEDEWSELEGRKVEPYSQWMGNRFLSTFHHWIPNDVTRTSNGKENNDYQFLGLRKRKMKKKKKKRTRGHRMTWQMYHRMADIHGYMDYLTATYPDTCSQETIGYSVEGRPLKVLKVSSGEPNSKAMWVDSGIHAREWITPATSTYVISQMVENGDGTHGVDWYFLPLVNPDGYEHSHTADRLWRKNRANAYKGPCAGTDLNRNFGYRWGGQGSSQQPCRETYAGTGPFSEPETNAINKFVMSKSKDLKAYVSLHSYGQYILYPWGYDRKVPPDYSDLHRVGRAMATAMRNSGGQIYRVGSAAATLYPASGGSDDWAKGTAKIKYAYTIELRDTGRHGFVLPAQYIQPTAKEAYAALKTLAEEVKQL